MYNFEPRKVRRFLKEENVDRAAIQLPSGLRPHFIEIKNVFDEEKVETIFLASNCYGACDPADDEAETLDCDALVHYGHSDMGIPTSLPTLYVEARMEFEPFDLLESILPELGGYSWGLTATVQHVHYLEEIKSFLEEGGVKSIIGQPGSRSKYPGQILGCDWSSALSILGEVDRFLYIGTGNFHPIGISLSTGKPVLLVNPVSGISERMDPELDKFLQKRYAKLEKAKSKENFGVLVSTKSGQRRLDLALDLSGELKEEGYNPCILSADEITPEYLNDFQLGAFVNTACPRIPFDDAALYDSPLLTPFELEVLLGETDWDPYRLDGINQNFEV